MRKFFCRSALWLRSIVCFFNSAGLLEHGLSKNAVAPRGVVYQHMGYCTHRNMILRVTDRQLLAKTGGIVQGMSGSPILQNGRLVGAVTHVLVNDPTRACLSMV